MIKSAHYEIRITQKAKKDIEKLDVKLTKKLRDILMKVIVFNPYEGKKLIGDLAGCYSCRLSLKDRIVYSIDDKKRIVFILRAKTHYGQ